jgi:serine/threonine protein kinase
LRFGPWETTSREGIEGDGIDALASDPDTGREVRLWIGAPGSGRESPPRPVLDEVRRRLARIYHAGLPRVLGSRIVDERVVIVVEPYRGVRLADRLREGTLEVLEALDLARGVGAALVKAHRGGVTHGAVGPSQILLAEDGRTLLLYAGLGPFLEPRIPRAPEDVGGTGSESGDVFGLSRTLVRALLGRDPLPEEPESLLEAFPAGFALREDELPGELPEGLRRFLARAVRTDLDGRIRRAEEFTGDLSVIRASWSAFTTASPTRPLPLPRRLPLRAWIAAGIVLGLLVAAAVRGCGG